MLGRAVPTSESSSTLRQKSGAFCAIRDREAREAAPGAGADAVPRSIRTCDMSRFPRTASTLVETAVALRSGATSASDLLTAATRRMGATRHLNAFIGGVLPRAIERAEASDERRRELLSGSATPEPRASLSTRDKGASSSSFPSPPGVQNRHLSDEMSEISEISSTDAKTTSRDPQDAQAPFSRSLSLLDGVPIAVKDNFFVPGAPTTAGSKVLQSFVTTDAREGAFESAVTRRLEKRGAVVFAKTNMDEFGMGSANKHSAFGRAVNPWRLVRRTGGRFSDETDSSETDSSVTDTDAQQTNRAPGGSSGGSAAAVASGVAIAAVGSDTGGSVRLPASYCGLVGVKPTYGRVSRWGLVPYCSSLDCPGFLTRTVADAVVLLSATQGKDACDPVTLPADARVDALAKDVERNADEATRRALRDKSRETSSSSSSSSFEETSAAANAAAESGASGARGFLKSRPGFPLAGWRVGIPAEYFVTELSDEVRSAWISTADVCEQMGASVVSVSLPNTRAALPAYYVIAPAEASSNLARYDGVRYGGDVSFSDEKKREPCGTLSEQSSDDDDSADDDSKTRSSAFEKGATSFRGARFGPEVNRRVLVGTFVSGSRRVARYKEKAMKVRRAVSLEFAEAFKKVDVLLTPTAPTTAPPLFPEAETMDNHGQAYGQIVGSYAADAMTVPASLAGLPAVSLPVGLGLTTGLPVGMQVIAARGNDADALGFAMRLEERINELGDEGGGAGPEAAEDHRDGDPPRSVVGWGERHRAVGVLEATRFEGGVM